MASGSVLNFTDPFPYQKALRISDVELFPTVKGEFRAELMQISLDRLWMQRGHENLPHVVAGTVRPVRKAISFLTKELKSAEFSFVFLRPLPFGDGRRPIAL
jgi:hypothetical protein